MVTSNGLLESNSDARAPLDHFDWVRLKELEAIVEQGVQTFCSLRFARVSFYRETYKTFEDYCRDKWAAIARWERDWDVRIAGEREKIRQELLAEYERQTNNLVAQIRASNSANKRNPAKY